MATWCGTRMSEHGEGTQRYGFEQFTLDPERADLQGPDGEVQLRPKSYDLLLYLVRHPGRLIGRDELLDAVWGHLAVTDDSVTQCLVEIRRALGDHARRIVRTVPRRGYLFDVPVTRLPAPSDPGGEAIVPAADAPASVTAAHAAPRRGKPQPRLAAAAVTMLALAIAWWAFATRDADRPGPTVLEAPAVPNSIAVLPFADMSAEGDQEYFGDGIAEEILNLLAQAPELKVIARTSSFSFKHQPVDITTIAARLGVAHVLEGSVRKWGNRVRVTAQLVSGLDGAHLWSQTYDRELGDLFEVQGDIAGAVAGVLEARLLARPAVAATPEARDIRAYDHFLRARFLFHRRDHDDLDQARSQLEAALAIDPEYAPAWALLSGVYSVQILEEGTALEIGVARRREAAERALALDPDLPEAHLRASAVYADAGDFDRALQHLEVARSLDPDNPLLLGLEAGRAVELGRIEEAIELWDRILALDPLSRVNRFNRGNALMAAGRLDEARADLLAARQLGAGRAREMDAWLALVLVLEGRYGDALALLEGAEEFWARDVALAMAHHGLGQERESAAAMARLRVLPRGEMTIGLAEAHAYRGEIDEAFSALAEARARFMGELTWGQKRWAQIANVSAFLRPLHGDPRWTALHAISGSDRDN